MISLRLMEDTIDDYNALRSWFLEPELQKWVWCDEEGEPIGFIQYYFSDATTIGLDMWIGILKERSNGLWH